jgi:serine/threonine-protein kinase HipA
MMTSKPIFIYLQRPDNHEWVTVGRYRLSTDSVTGKFQYAPSYLTAGLCWSIDPVNLPIMPEHIYTASRYRGLHDVLRDAGPDTWGKHYIQREYQLPQSTHESQYLLLSDNAHRWGALAMGTSKEPDIARIGTPRLPELAALTHELIAISERRPAADPRLRRRLVGTPSAGGARPKATIKDKNTWWLVKPFLPSDSVDIPLLEHATHEWGALVGLRFAKTVIHRLSETQSVLRVHRFDRSGEQRHMALSAASLLQAEYPAVVQNEHTRWSYPRLAEELQRIGAPPSDLKELFGRMVFNAMVGNDDDHPRNHAVVYNFDLKRWGLAPAFDVVPNPEETPRTLAMQVSAGSWLISRTSLLVDYIRFGFNTLQEAESAMDALIAKMHDTYSQVAALLSPELARLMEQRLAENTLRLSNTFVVDP